MTSHDKIHSSSINKNISKDDKMAPINRTVKINLDGTSRAVDVPAPPSLAALQTAVCSAFHSEISSSSSVARGGEIKLSFAWTDANGDDVVFDKDSELNLALRLCGDSLEISATRKAELVKEPAKPEADRIYKVAARTLREYHGVPSMTPVKLTKTLTLLQLSPRRLVKQGLAPTKLLHNVGKNADGKGPKVAETNDDLVEMAAEDMELMSTEDDRKEWADGCVPAGDEKSTAMPQEAPAVAEAVTSSSDESSTSPSSSSSDTDTEKVPAADGGKPKNVIHAAFVDAGIQLRPRETMPLLLGLGVRPMRLVKLGLVDFHELRAMRIYGRCGGGDGGRGRARARAIGGPACSSRRHGDGHQSPGPRGDHGGWAMFLGGSPGAMFGRRFGGPRHGARSGGEHPHRRYGPGHGHDHDEDHAGSDDRHRERRGGGKHHHRGPPPPPRQHGRMGWARGYGGGGDGGRGYCHSD